MNEAERKKYDEAEASGLLPRLRLVVQSVCAPIWWEIDGKTILDSGSMCVIATPQSVFGVTANHVLTIYEGHKVAHPDAFCQLGSAPFDPIPNLIARSEHWDLATFRIPDFTLKHWGRDHRIYKTEAWPPPAIKKDDPVILGGYPTNRRTQTSGKRPATMTSDFVSFMATRRRRRRHTEAARRPPAEPSEPPREPATSVRAWSTWGQEYQPRCPMCRTGPQSPRTRAGHPRESR